MNREQIMKAIRQLAYSQGSYGRLYCALCRLRDDEPEKFDNCMAVLEEQNFKDAVALVMYLES